MAERILLSMPQLDVLSAMLAVTDFERIVIENTNLDGTVAVQLDGKWTLVAANGAFHQMPDND